MRFAPALAAILLLSSPALAAPPENELGEILFKARELDGLKRVAGTQHYDSSDEKTYLSTMETKVEKARIDLLFTDYHKASPADQMGAVVNFGGSLHSLSFARGPEIAKGVVKGGKIVLDDDAQTTKELPKGSVVPFPMALFILPAYHELLPKEFVFTTLVGAQAMPGFRLLVKEKKGDLQLVELQGPGGIKMGIYVSTAGATKGQIRQLEVDGKIVKRITAEAAAKLIKDHAPKSGGAPTPRAAVENLIKACAESDLDAISDCFSSKAPGEFQSLVKKTVPAKNFNQFCLLFDGAKVTEVKVEGSKAVVSVQLKKRAEKLTVVKEGDVWRVLDF